MRTTRAAVVVLALLLSLTAGAQQVSVASFNVESGEATTARLRQDILRVPQSDIWGFSEVLNDSWAAAFESALSTTDDYDRILGTTGGDDRLAIVYNKTRLELVSTRELSEIGGTGSRSPLVARFRLRENGQEFLFIVNHLNRGNAAKRHEQATMLNAFAVRPDTPPIIAVGDYNFDWNLPNGDANHDRGYDNITANGVFKWVRPATLIKTQCDPSFNSVLDFVFTSKAAQNWNGVGEIHFREVEYCQDDAQRSDHRPVRAQFTLGSTIIVPDPQPNPLKAQLLQRIEALEREIRELRRLIEQLP
jgi:endonuclease/exonuclease/phosphatase family metal-dependent hydrolase